MKYVSLSCLLLLGLASCTTTTKTTRSTASTVNLQVQDYFPLRVGDERVYQVRYLSPKRLLHKNRIVRKAKGTFFDSDGEHYQYDPWGLRGRKRYLLRYPLKVGTKWMSVVNFRVERYRIVSTQSRLRVPAGQYNNCIVVHANEDPTPSGYSHNRMVFAPKVGLVKVQTYRVLPSGKKVLQNTTELVSYKPGQSGSTGKVKKVSSVWKPSQASTLGQPSHRAPPFSLFSSFSSNNGK